jgi:DNA mismatch repair protein MutS2
LEEEPVPIEISDVFDLHSVPSRDVKGVVEEYLSLCSTRGFKYIRIVHGRGIGTRREMVRGVLARTPFVASFEDAPPEAGGWGATVATLRLIK